MIKINLFPLKEIKRKKMIRRLIIINILFFITVSLSTIIVFFKNLETINSLESAIKKEKQKLTQLTSLRKKIKEFKQKQKILETKLKIIKELNSNRLYPSFLFYIISKNIPDEVWINYLSANEKKISIKGIALDEPTVVKFIEKLKYTKFFKNIYLNQINQIKVQNLYLKEFKMDLYPDLTKLKEIL